MRKQSAFNEKQEQLMQNVKHKDSLMEKDLQLREKVIPSLRQSIFLLRFGLANIINLCCVRR